ncbi:MAG TPA: ribosome maturation factor RimM [Caulobacteraceae bacterium]|jgi:16S rRNA processing protein RimM|nr:ribosome maturation factor RimM [Caulobacteraceae bacterium]
MAQRLILVGQAAGAFGVRGEIRITTHTAEPMSLLAYSPLRDAGGEFVLTLLSARPAKGGLIARAREVTNREQGERLRGLKLYVDRAALPATEADEFYLADLIGLRVRSTSGDPLGLVKSAADFGAGDLLEIEPANGGPSWWTPFTREAVPEVDIAGGWVTLAEGPQP